MQTKHSIFPTERRLPICIGWLLGLVLAAAVFALPAAADGSRADALPQQNPRVLFITSYSYAWPTVPQQLEGLQSVLDDEIALTVRCMDTKSLNSEKSRALFADQTRLLLETSAPFDAVVVGDDDALQFVQAHRSDLFAGIPVVFEGINDLDAALDAAADGLTTGVVEQMSYADNLALALQINPQAKQVVAILDDTATGAGERDQFYAQTENYPGLEFAEINTSLLTEAQLRQALADVRQDAILIYLIASHDSAGRSYTNQQICAMIEQNASVPCFRFVSAGIGQGVLGGYVVSHYESGAIAGRMVMQILSGASPADIPVQTDSPTTYLFDYRVMQKYHIDKKLLPPDAQLLYYEPTFWEANGRTVAVTAAVVLAVMGALVLVLSTHSIAKTNTILARKNLELADAIADAEQANRAKTLFLSNVSHDLRTPVNAIVNLTALARRDTYDAGKMWQTLDRIDAASKLLQGIINDVLDLSAIENEKIKLVREPFRLHKLLDELADLYRGQCEEKGLQFTLEAVDLTDELIVGDPLRLNQILMNLVSNALKFTPAGGSVRVEARQLTRQDGRVRIRFTVQDTGVGISAEAQKRIFEPYEQEDAMTARQYGGSGLGLAIVRTLVEMSSGTVTCRSEKGQGAAFTVELPFACAAPDGEGVYRGLRVLSVEDDRAVRATVGDLLTSLGVAYDEADKDQAAGMLTAARAEGRPYGLCIVGWQPTDLPGLELVRRIRSLFDSDSLTVLVSAQEAIDRVEQQAKAGGADSFAARPLTEAALVPVLQRATERARCRDSADHAFDFGGRRVLLAEDEAMSAEPLVELLHRAHLEVDWVTDGAQAAERFAAAMPGQYAAILMDIQMPVMDGYEATRVIRTSRHPLAGKIPIIAVSAHVFADSMVAIRSAGMNDHVAKPVDSKTLFATLSKYIG